MVKGNNNLKNKGHQSSKPYDVSNSFVRKITSRVSELLPHSMWLNRWLSPAEVPVSSSILKSQQLSSIVTSHSDIPHASTSRSDLNAVEDSVDHYIPTKRPRLPFKSQFQPGSFLFSSNLDSGNEEISPIVTRGELLCVSPTGPGSLNKPGLSDFVSSTPAGEGSVALCDKLNSKYNGDDCSETSESTSGCSSLVPQAQSTVVSRKVNSKDINTSTQTQSIIPTRRTAKVDLSILQRRRPVFNTTTFASPGRILTRIHVTQENRTEDGYVLVSENVIQEINKSMIGDQGNSSPFYVGRTMFGGAASNCTLNTSTTSRHMGPKVKPVNSFSQNLPLSSTAKRILDALEQFSTPVLDAKLSIGNKRKLENSTQRYAELSIPTTPDLLRVKRREKLLNSTCSARQMSATASSVHSYTTTSEDINNQYKLRKDGDESDQYAGKVRVRDRCVSVQQPEAVRLPQIKLSLNSLPAIDISVPPPPPTPPPTQGAEATRQPFVFAVPLMVESQSYISDVTSTYNFNFSSPLCVTSSEKCDSDFSSKNIFNLNIIPTKTFSVENNHSCKAVINESDKIISDNNVADQLNTASKANILDSKEKTPEIIPKGNCVNPVSTVQNISTDCSESCSLPNTVSDACKKELVNKKYIHSSEIISSKNGKSSTDLWKCKQCHVKTIVKQDTTCPACQNANKSFQSGFGNKFKPPIGSWKCQTCCIYNDKDVFECIACGTKKLLEQNDEQSENKNSVPIIGFGNMFKQPVGSWSCKECWSQNPSTILKCAACETPKPGSSESERKQKTSPNVTFGSTSDNAGFVFGIDKAGGSVKHTQTDSIQKLQNVNNNNNNTENTIECVNDSVKENSSFQFGISKSISETTELNYTFGMPCRSSQLPSAQEKKQNGSNTADVPKPAVDTEGKNKSEDSNLQSTESVQNVLDSSSQVECIKTETLQNSNTPVMGNTTRPPIDKSQDTVSENAGTVSKLPVSSTAGFTFGRLKPFSNVESQNNRSATNNTNFVFGSAVSTPSSFQNNTGELTTTSIFSSNEIPANTFKFEPTKIVSGTGSVVTAASGLKAKPNTTVSINSGMKGNTQHTFGTVINHEEKNNFFSSEMKVAPFASSGSSSSTTFREIYKDSDPNNLELKQRNFSNSANKELSANLFGSQTTPKSHVFGQSATSATTVPTFSLFGSTFQNTNSFPNIDPVQENKSAPAFTFGTPSNKEEASTQGFTFSPVVEKPQTFGFTTPGNTNNNGFAFNTIGTPSSTFSFTPKTENKTNLFNTAVPTFGSAHTNSASTFGIPQPAPAFGESLTTPSPVFTFGATPQPQQQPAPGVFAFPASQNTCGPAPTSSTSNFVFGSSAASSTPTPTFDPNVKPTFNFTGGATPSFTATVPSSISQDGAAPRKFRKAVRRQTQR